MSLPLPTNVQMHDHPTEGRGVAFKLELDGRARECFITNESLDGLYCRHRNDADRMRRVERHSYLSVLVAERMRVGAPSEPIVISNLSKGPHSIPCPLCGSENAEFWFVDAYNRRHFHCPSCTEFQISRRAADIVADRPPEWRQQLAARAAARPAGKSLVIQMPKAPNEPVNVTYVAKADLPT